jgi:molybdate transport system substrate-binding protein
MTVTLNLLCAGGFRAAMDSLAPAFEKATGISLNLTFATPAKTREWLEAGFPFDLGIVVGAVLETARRDGLGFSENTFKLALSPIGMGVPENGPSLPVSTLEDFTTSLNELESVALSDPKAGTNLANEVLASAETAGLTALRAKALFIQGPGSVVSGEVAKGMAQAVITLASEIVPIKGVKYLGQLPAALQTEYAMSVLAGETPSREVETLISFLRGPEAKEAMSHVGLTPV